MKIGVLGGGQLGQMLTLAGYPLGLDVDCYDPNSSSPAGLVGPLTVGELSDMDALHAWADDLDVLTYESENYPAELIGDLSEKHLVCPNVRSIVAAQDRWAEKRLFNANDIPVPAFRPASDSGDLRKAIDELGLPVVVKTRSGGYDGKGQVVLRSADDIARAEALVADTHVIVEKFVPFDYEVSVVGVRSSDGTFSAYPITENEHRQGILHRSQVPSRLPAHLQEEAKGHLARLLKALDYVGTAALELFVAGDRLLGNEMAPRVHNSGHWTIEGADTSQFENHLRAISDLPIGSTDARCPTAMINLIGRVPATEDVLAVPGAALHLYGKSARPGRKLGHVTVTAADASALQQRVEQLEAVVKNDLG